MGGWVGATRFTHLDCRDWSETTRTLTSVRRRVSSDLATSLLATECIKCEGPRFFTLVWPWRTSFSFLWSLTSHSNISWYGQSVSKHRDFNPLPAIQSQIRCKRHIRLKQRLWHHFWTKRQKQQDIGKALLFSGHRSVVFEKMNEKWLQGDHSIHLQSINLQLHSCPTAPLWPVAMVAVKCSM